MQETKDTAEYGLRDATLSRDSGITRRLTLVALLTITLFGAIRWAVDVTNANARRVSHNLAQMQAHLDENVQRGTENPGGINPPGPKARRKFSEQDAPR